MPGMSLTSRLDSLRRQLGCGVCVTLFAFAPTMESDEEGARGCAALASETPAPDMEGTWDVEYADDLSVKIGIGGATYTSEIQATGGVIEIEHDGQPIRFELDCSREDVVCPSEAWPREFTAEHRSERYPHQVTITLPGQECDGELVTPDASECGEGTQNPDCEDVCDGEVIVGPQDRLGAISEDGEHFDILLGAGVASNGINCALLGLSVARADIVGEKSPRAGGPWDATALENGEVVVGYAGGCLWADDVDGDADLEALVLGASVEFTTSFEATKR
jgi:hypothetical protein